MADAWSLYEMMGRRIDWAALPILCGAYGFTLDDLTVGRLLLFARECKSTSG